MHVAKKTLISIGQPNTLLWHYKLKHIPGNGRLQSIPESRILPICKIIKFTSCHTLSCSFIPLGILPLVQEVKRDTEDRDEGIADDNCR
jgi:hypothetical protein